jgi:hypothetical protein
MSKTLRVINLSIVILFIFSLFPAYNYADEVKVGSLMGFLYTKDCKTPVKGAQVILTRVKKDKDEEYTGEKVFKSNITDSNGDYKLIDIPVGNYKISIKLDNKNYKVKKIDFLATIIEGKTSYMSFCLKIKRSVAIIIVGTSAAAALGASVITEEEEEEQSPTKK